MKDSEIRYMIEEVSADMAVYLSEEFGLDVTESLDALYNSDTYIKLNNPKTGLYFQSPKYVYSFLRDEMMNREAV